jgi:hypothetical protein
MGFHLRPVSSRRLDLWLIARVFTACQLHKKISRCISCSFAMGKTPTRELMRTPRTARFYKQLEEPLPRTSSL